jgi:hypothetical protein
MRILQVFSWFCKIKSQLKFIFEQIPIEMRVLGAIINPCEIIKPRNNVLPTFMRFRDFAIIQSLAISFFF